MTPHPNPSFDQTPPVVSLEVTSTLKDANGYGSVHGGVVLKLLLSGGQKAWQTLAPSEKTALKTLVRADFLAPLIPGKPVRVMAFKVPESRHIQVTLSTVESPEKPAQLLASALLTPCE